MQRVAELNTLPVLLPIDTTMNDNSPSPSSSSTSVSVPSNTSSHTITDNTLSTSQ